MPKLSFFTASLSLFLSIDTLAWGPEGHRVVGQAAFGLLDETARAEVLAVLDLPPGDTRQVAKAEVIKAYQRHIRSVKGVGRPGQQVEA